MSDEGEKFEECGGCGHFHAYHDGQSGRVCRAFTDVTEDLKCACKGWKKPNPKIAAVTNDNEDEPNGW